MKEKDALAELSSIREMMERSSKFVSISGIAGILAGMFALAGAWMVSKSISAHGATSPDTAIQQACLIAGVVLLLSMMTSFWFAKRKANRAGQSVWNPVSRRLLTTSGIPFLTGGVVMLIMLAKGEYTWIAPMSLLFYGLSLIAGSAYTFHEIKWLGIAQLLLGIVALQLTTQGLLIWAAGFGVLHILYGIYMHFKYEK